MTGRLGKLRAMSAAEVLDRIRYRGYCELERRFVVRRWRAPDRLRAGLVPPLRRHEDWQTALIESRSAAASCFHGELTRRDEYRRVVSELYPAELADLRHHVSQARRNEVQFFGRTFTLGPRIRWHRDPVTNRDWPRTYHGDVPVKGGDVGFGDVKYVWELNRHQFFVDLAKSCYLDDNQDDARVLQHLHASWMEDCPYGTGVPWANALEPAFRVFSWLWCYFLCKAAGALPPEDEPRWLTGFLDHGRFLARHLERFSSPYNHLAGEASALFQLGALFPEFRESGRWRTLGKQILEQNIAGQFHDDGGTVEQSTFYHHATLGFYLLAALIGRRNNDHFSDSTWLAIERGCEFSMALAWPDGQVPSIGGADDGKPLRMEHLPLWDFRYYQAIGAVLFRRSDFKSAAGRFWEDAFWLLGLEGRSTFDRIQPAAPETVHVFPRSGYVALRSDWSPGADYICFDCGPQAAGLRRDSIPSAAHGHADGLSVIAALGGRRVLVDPGFYCYNCADGWDVYFRKTAPHNTITIDDRDQARHISKMAWAETYSATLETATCERGILHAVAHHDGFARTAEGVVHRRHILAGFPGYVVIGDELIGTGAHSLQANYQFAAGTLTREGPHTVLFDGRFALTWCATVPLEACLRTGGPLPDGGWIAPSLGVKVEAPRLTLNGLVERASEIRIVSVLTDRTRAGPNVTFTSCAQDGLLAVISGGATQRIVFGAAGPGTKTSLRVEQ